MEKAVETVNNILYIPSALGIPPAAIKWKNGKTELFETKIEGGLIVFGDVGSFRRKMQILSIK